MLNNHTLVTSSSNTGIKPNVTSSSGAVISPGAKINLLDAPADSDQGTWMYRFGDFESAMKSVQ